MTCPMCGYCENAVKEPGQRLRSPAMKIAKAMKVGDSLLFSDQDEAHKMRIYISRAHGTGAGSWQKQDRGGYRVWRTK